MRLRLSRRFAANSGILYALLLFAMPTVAAAADHFQLVDGSADLRSRSTRLQLARELAAEIGGVARRVPTPSAADQAMVKNEIS